MSIDIAELSHSPVLEGSLFCLALVLLDDGQ